MYGYQNTTQGSALGAKQEQERNIQIGENCKKSGAAHLERGNLSTQSDDCSIQAICLPTGFSPAKCQSSTLSGRQRLQWHGGVLGAHTRAALPWQRLYGRVLGSSNIGQALPGKSSSACDVHALCSKAIELV